MMRDELLLIFGYLSDGGWWFREDVDDSVICTACCIDNVDYYVGVVISYGDDDCNADLQFFCWTNDMIVTEQNKETLKRFLTNVNDYLTIAGGFYINESKNDSITFYCEWSSDPIIFLLEESERIISLEDDIKSLAENMVVVFNQYHPAFKKALEGECQLDMVLKLVAAEIVGHA